MMFVSIQLSKLRNPLPHHSLDVNSRRNLFYLPQLVTDASGCNKRLLRLQVFF